MYYEQSSPDDQAVLDSSGLFGRWVGKVRFGLKVMDVMESGMIKIRLPMNSHLVATEVRRIFYRWLIYLLLRMNRRLMI